MKDLGVIPDGAVLIVDGVIQESGPARRVENLAAARLAAELDVAGKVVLPSFVDPLSFVTGLPVGGAAFEPDSPAHPRSPAVERQIEESLTRQCRAASAGKLAFYAARVLQDMVRHGTGTLEIHAGIGLEDSPGSKAFRATSRLDGGPIDVTQSLLLGQPGLTEFQGREEDYVRWVADLLLPRLARRDPVQAACICLGYGILDPYFASDCLAAAGRLGLRLGVSRGPLDADSAIELALSGRVSSVSGLSNLSANARAALAESHTAAILRPVLSYNGWRDPEPARELIDLGAIVALATGWHPVFSPVASMPMIISLACSLYALKPAEALTAATVNSAAALGLLDQCGTLEPGKQGDFLVLSIPDFRDLPVMLGVNPVEAVVKRGAVVWQRGEVTWPRES
jgi:imidazolonepropionase